MTMEWLCPTNVEEWKAANKAPLFPGVWNRWLLARTGRDNPDDKTLRDTLAAVMTRWFPNGDWGRAEVLVTYTVPAGSARSGQVTTSAGVADLIHVVKVWRGQKFPPVLPAVKRREQLTVLPTLRSGYDDVYMLIEFVYRGTAREMPWPVYRAADSIFTYSGWCPIEADWMLVQALQPDVTEKPPSPLTPGEKVVTNVQSYVPTIAVVGGLVVIAAALGAFASYKITR
jgi:hypothetical protein